MSPTYAVAVASVEGDLNAHIAQLQKTVRSQQATIDEQEARLRKLEILVARMRQSLGIQVPAGACASASTLAAQGVGDVIACPDASSSQAVIACPRAEAHCGAEHPEGSSFAAISVLLPPPISVGTPPGMTRNEQDA